MAYFIDLPVESIPDLEVKMHTVYELDPTVSSHDAKEIKLL